MKFILPLILAVPGVTAVTTMNQALMMRLTDLRNDEDSRVLSDVWRTVTLGAIMGVKDFNARDARYTAAMGTDALATCDVQINPTMYDTGSNSKGSIMAYRAARADHFDGTDYSLHSIVGAARSDASKPMATLGAIDSVPQTSYWSTSDGLDDTGVYSYFSRTIPADSAVAKAAAELMKAQGHTKVGIAHVDDPYGGSWKDAFVKYCSEYDPPIQVVATGFVGGNKDSAENSAVIFQAQDVRVGFVIAFDSTYGYFMDKAEALGMIGPGYFWLAGDGVGNAKVQGTSAKQMNGIGKMLSLGGVPGAAVYDQFKADWDMFDSSPEGAALKTYAEAMWIDIVADAGHALPEGTDLSLIPATFFADNVPDDVATYAYDAVMQHGIGACAYTAAGGTFDASFNGGAFYSAITETEFTSITGSVRFLDSTGSRDPASSNFILYNWQCEGAEGSETCTQYTAGSWTMAGGWDYSGGDTPDADSNGSPDGFRFSDNRLTPPSDRPSEIEELRMGFLHPFYTLDGTDYVYSRAGHNNMVGSLLALQEINSNPDLLPNTQLKFEVLDTHHDAGMITGHAIDFATTAFGGKGANVVVGGAYSGPTMAAQNVLKGFGIPQMSYSATSPLLSDSKEYPYFYRPCPSDAFQGAAVAQFLKEDLEFENVCVVHGDDSYNAGLAQAFKESSFDLDLNVVKTIELNWKPEVKDAKQVIQDIANSQCRIVFFSLHPDASSRIVREAYLEGIMGPGTGWLWHMGDAATVAIADVISAASVPLDYCTDGALVSVDDCAASEKKVSPGIDAENALIGSTGCIPLAPSGDALAAFMNAYEAMDNTEGTCGNDAPVTESCSCAEDTDNAGVKLFQRDHDNDPSTPDRCVGFEYKSTEDGYFAPDGYSYYAYDVVYAFAFAAQKMLDDGETSFSSSGITEALKDISFPGVTGTVDFETSGDREIGVGFTIRNFEKDTGMNTIGNWDKATGLVFDGAQSVKTMTWSTADGSIPSDVPPPPFEEKNLLSGGLVSIGTILVVFNYLVAIVLGGMTFWKRKNKVIRASQPMFLAMVLIGCCVSTSTILFFSEDDSGEYDKAGDVNCMMQPVFYSLGFTFSFAALFAKITRIAKIFGNKKLMRVTITWVDMMKPIVVLLAVDIVILALWSSDEKAALKWERIPKTTDSAGYVLESTGMCTSESPWVYGGLILSLHFAVLVYGNYMCYKSRNAGTAFSESKYVFMAMVSNLQIMALGVPMLIMVYDNPVSNYFMRTGIVFMNDVGVMLLIFIPKFNLIFFGSQEDLELATSTGAATSNNTSHGAEEESAKQIKVLEDEVAELKAKLEAK